eukprot:262903-Chlamydomonas_euryale.AAC.2
MHTQHAETRACMLSTRRLVHARSACGDKCMQGSACRDVCMHAQHAEASACTLSIPWEAHAPLVPLHAIRPRPHANPARMQTPLACKPCSRPGSMHHALIMAHLPHHPLAPTFLSHLP